MKRRLTSFHTKPRKPLKRAQKPIRRTKLRVVGHSTTSELKNEIQAILRQIVIKRDGGCILRNTIEAGVCGGYNAKDELILQAEHLHTRANAASFADSRLVVCLCKRHHIFWKPQHADEYYRLVKKIIGEERTALLEKVQNDHRPHKQDLKLDLLALKQELNEKK